MKNLIKTIQSTAFQNSLWKRGDKIVVGVSGGADSACLLDTLAKIAPKADLELIVTHVNYALRGKDSDKDEAFVKDLAEKYALPAYVLKPKARKNSSENELRDIRYDFFEKVRQENGFNSIAVAHNADDQVETFLMRVIRGAGLQGLSAMRFKSGNIIRPLLNISRKEIFEYIKKNSLRYRDDKTNSEAIFFRNKIRNKLLPELEKNYNPGIRKTISASVSSIAEDSDFLNLYATEILRCQKELRVSALLSLHPALQRRVILHYIYNFKNDLKNIDSAHITELLKAFRSYKGKQQTVSFQGLKFVRKGDKVILCHK